MWSTFTKRVSSMSRKTKRKQFYLKKFLLKHRKNSLLTHEKLLPSNVPSNNMSRIAECCSSITINEPEPTMNRSASLQSNLLKDDGLAECTFSKCGCNFKTLNLSKLNIYNQENIRKNMNVCYPFFYHFL